MSLQKYPYKTNPDFLDFEFESKGPRGVIRKVARFTLLNQGSVYNFGFGDLHPLTGEISDTVVSNNGDGDKILATVATIIMDFTERFPGAAVLIEGTSASRTRRYQMGISKHWSDIKETLQVYGYKSGKWEPFQTGINYEKFIGRRLPLL